jgi:predicted nuclease of restriction endonuclease-like (RecB) superfamily
MKLQNLKFDDLMFNTVTADDGKQLLFATSKDGKNYTIKREQPETAGNEIIYAFLAEKFGLNYAPIYSLENSTTSSLFKNAAVAVETIQNAIPFDKIEKPTSEQIIDYAKTKALSDILGDKLEVATDKQGMIYKTNDATVGGYDHCCDFMKTLQEELIPKYGTVIIAPYTSVIESFSKMTAASFYSILNTITEVCGQEMHFYFKQVISVLGRECRMAGSDLILELERMANKNIEPSIQQEFQRLVAVIEKSRDNAFRAVNRELIDMYWEVGKTISEKVKSDGWGKSTVSDFSDFIQTHYLGIKGFSPQNIWRMKQFYETYKDDFTKLSTLWREISWSNNRLIMSLKSLEEREFYLTLSVQNNYSVRQLERQIETGFFERTMINEIKNKDIIARSPGLSALRDSYSLEFLGLPEQHKEKDLRKALIKDFKKFILEFGKDFTLVDDEYRVQVGDSDFFIDILLFNRYLSCLVAIELKTTKFKPEHV